MIIAAMATGTSSAFQVWSASRRTTAMRHDHQAADGGDMPQVARDCGLVPVNIVSREQEEGGHQGQDPQGPPRLVAQAQRALGGLMFHPQQDELLLADRLSLLDQDVALGVRYRSARPPGFWPRRGAAP